MREYVCFSDGVILHKMIEFPSAFYLPVQLKNGKAVFIIQCISVNYAGV